MELCEFVFQYYYPVYWRRASGLWETYLHPLYLCDNTLTSPAESCITHYTTNLSVQPCTRERPLFLVAIVHPPPSPASYTRVKHTRCTRMMRQKLFDDLVPNSKSFAYLFRDTRLRSKTPSLLSSVGVEGGLPSESPRPCWFIAVIQLQIIHPQTHLVVLEILVTLHRVLLWIRREVSTQPG